MLIAGGLLVSLAFGEQLSLNEPGSLPPPAGAVPLLELRGGRGGSSLIQRGKILN